MKRSTAGHLLTTHVGSLPRPPALRDVAESGRDEALTTAVAEVVRLQVHAGIDVVSDGEMSKPSYSTYVADRVDGFGGVRRTPPRFQEADEFPDWAASPMTGIVLSDRPMPMPACDAPLRRVDHQSAHRDAANLLAAIAAEGAAEGFLNAASPGVLTVFLENQHYPSHDAYLEALASVMQEEYEAIHAAGLLVQIDAPDLVSRNVQFPDLSTEEWKPIVEGHLEVINAATANIPAEDMRIHVCWGNHEGPHTHDVPLHEMLPLLLRARPAGLCLQSANPRHAHEWRVFEEIALPEDKVLIPGVIDTTTNFVEHPELVAERLEHFLSLIPAEQLIAGTDCGMATFADYFNVHPTVAYAKLAALAEGAALASARH